MRPRTRAAAGDDFEIVQSNRQDFAGFAGPGAIVVGHEGELSRPIDLYPGRPGRRKTGSTDPTIRRTLELRQRRIAVCERGIPVAAIGGDGQAVWFVALRWTWIEGDAGLEGTGFRIEPQDFVGHGDRHVHRGATRIFSPTGPVPTAAARRRQESGGGQNGRATDQNCGSSVHRPVFMSET